MNYKRTMRYFGKGLKGSASLCIGGAMIINPYIVPVGAVMLVKGAKDVSDFITGNYIENSIMKVQSSKFWNRIVKTPNNSIVQSLPTTKQFCEALISSSKMDFLKLQEFNFLLGLDRCDVKGNTIQYNTCTHSGNYMMLKQLEKQGIISNLSKSKAGKSNMRLGKLLMGNVGESVKRDNEYKAKRKQEIKQNVLAQNSIIDKIKTLRDELKLGINKKTQMYNVSFQKTDKVFSDEEIAKLLPFSQKDGTIDKDRFNIRRDKAGNIVGLDYKTSYVISSLKVKSKEKLQRGVTGFEDKLKSLVKTEDEMSLGKGKEKKVKEEPIKNGITI